MADEEKGPKRTAKHTPGRGHRRKSEPHKKKRFQAKAAKKRQTKQDDLQQQWDEWDALPPEVQKLRPEMKPKMPRPSDEN